jgi:predicted DNA-binding protein with PD1-like motif
LLQDENGLKTFALVFEKDEEVKESLLRFASENGLGGAQLTAIGAFSEVTLGFFDRHKKSYQEIPVKQQVELLSFAGNIVEKDGKPLLHAHVVVGKADGTAHGGHFLQGRVWPTLEMIMTETPAHLRRVKDEETGLPLIDLDASGTASRTRPRGNSTACWYILSNFFETRIVGLSEIC